MNRVPDSILVPFTVCQPASWGPLRRAEPVTVGVPLPRHAVPSADLLRVLGNDDSVIPVQVRSLEDWPDGSVRWALLDFQVDSARDSPPAYRLALGSGPGPAPASPVTVSTDGPAIRVDTGAATFDFGPDGAFPIAGVSVAGRSPIDGAASGLVIAIGGHPVRFEIGEARVVESGPLRAEIVLDARPRGTASAPLTVSARVELFAGSATARVAITIRNPRRAQHPGGVWVLGDPGSVHITSATVALALTAPIEQLAFAAEAGQPLTAGKTPFEIVQESSGGQHWNGPIHLNQHGKVPLRMRGYRRRSGADEATGLRASPVVGIETRDARIAIAAPQFWENFPRAIRAMETSVEIGLFPAQGPEPVELQGGEQKTHTVAVAFDGDAVSDPPLAWVHDPVLLFPPPAWSADAEALPFLAPRDREPDERYRALVDLAHDPATGFVAKRERADEYGWRNFGDMPADHESSRQPPDQPFVSHYNNQYDVIAGCAIQFLRTGDARWWRYMTELAAHVRDIDIYHTRDDKVAYNGGMFWPTQHYTDAGISTHRTYDRGTHGGGPAAEHNYNVGFMLHYFLTGDRRSRRAAIGLGRWVQHMENGRRTIFRFLTTGATGLATGSGSVDYHGPGRAVGNSVLACVIASRLSGDRSLLDTAETLIRRSIHPADDIATRSLEDIERRWYYTMFLQALGAYLHFKADREEFDRMWVHARDGLLHYARWMVVNEYPYLERPERLEFPTETWAGQEMRKAEVFWWAALHASGDERQTFLAKAREFFDYSVNKLATMPTRVFTRPIVLLMTNGWRHAWFAATPLPAPHAVPSGLAPHRPVRFEPQRIVALRRAKVVAAAAIAALGVIAVWAVFG